MQKIVYILLFGFLFTSISAQEYKKYALSKDKLLSEGVLNIISLTEKSIRIQYQIENKKEAQEFVFINKPNAPRFSLKENTNSLEFSTKSIVVNYNKKTGVLTYSDKLGNVFLREKANTRLLKPNTIMGEPCFIAEQGFESPQDEYLFGLGQFQDGFYNLKNTTRKLIQVNTQIAIPFLVSNKGYGLLWHQYGLTYFNSTNQEIPLIMDFNNDIAAVSNAYEDMFGKAFLIAPVTAPDVTNWEVYLPKQNAWFDFWTGKRFEGGQTISFPAPLDKIPVFVKEG
ncbi:TIM-barrel domain-containing protein [Flavobacterium cheongpyeongense]|uniref:TIM-barrel domain-containing protein n=1 Tax=Flavobacterium cheongpyeongense TaxID=2212651 RepID=UPI001403235B|nr:TIM-barrel domain-containing protein [Flavobacterium cheongpyeongense]